MYIRLISFGLICRPEVLGQSRASGPAPKPAECFVGGDRARRMLFEASRGSRESRAERRAGRVGLSAAVPRTTETERSERARWIKIQPPRLKTQVPCRLRTRVASRDMDHRENRPYGNWPPQCVVPQIGWRIPESDSNCR